jgi:dTDP-glucose 4,6-dehydratase
VIHAATEASAKLNDENPLLMFDTIVTGTQRTLEFAQHCGAKNFCSPVPAWFMAANRLI